MSTVMEIRLLFIVGIVALAMVIVGLALLTQWLTGRVTRGTEWLAASRVRDARLEHDLGARAARWRMLL